MKRIIILIITIPFLYSCNQGNDQSINDKPEKENYAVADTEEDGSVKLTYATEGSGINTDKYDSTSNEPKPISGLVSKHGNDASNSDSKEAKEEALRIRRAHTEFNNGTTYYKEGNLEKAIESFKKSLEYKQDNAKAFYNLGKIYYELGQKELSHSYYKDAVELNPNDSLSMVAIGLIYYEKGNIEEASRYYEKTLEIAPKFGMVYFNRGTMLGQNNQYELALEDLNKAIKYDPQNSEAFINRGLAHFYMRNLDLACKDWKKAESMGNPKGKDAVKLYCSGNPNRKNNK